jgi:hypothetical protein
MRHPRKAKKLFMYPPKGSTAEPRDRILLSLFPKLL